MQSKRQQETTDQSSEDVDVKCVFSRKPLKYRSLKSNYITDGESFSYPSMSFMTVADKSHCMWIGSTQVKILNRMQTHQKCVVTTHSVNAFNKQIDSQPIISPKPLDTNQSDNSNTESITEQNANMEYAIGYNFVETIISKICNVLLPI